ncbi:MAG TPA: polysaccharide biosynthesis/export family protein [Vicinamibacteria bacterium]|nr:polysaccharide biosynthesis/export family protein [Vicinamibacteria bacterium]
MGRRRWCLVAVLALAGAPLAAQGPPSPPPAPAPAQDSAYVIGPEDILRVVVYGQADLSQTVVVQPDGSITFPLVGRIVASGLTPEDLRRSLVTLLSKRYLRNPQVTVTVQEYRSKSVFVVGEVARPGTYALQGATTVVEVLAKAGPTPSAGPEVIIVRPRREVEGPLLPEQVSGEGKDAEVIRVNVREIQMGRLAQNVVLKPKDTVFVTEAPKVFVSGEVRSPGAYAFRSGITVRQAISLAGGLTPDGSTGRLRVVREVAGKTRELKIRIDDPVQPGDTIVVKAKLF